MNYELEKELENAGFPQGKCTCEATESNPEAVCKNMRTDRRCNPITLSELIEACGERFRDLEKYTNTENGELVEKWQANAMKDAPASSKRFVDTWKGKGITPEEAVARLWLALIKTGV